jgi:hypothetical protein
VISGAHLKMRRCLFAMIYTSVTQSQRTPQAISPLCIYLNLSIISVFASVHVSRVIIYAIQYATQLMKQTIYTTFHCIQNLDI